MAELSVKSGRRGVNMLCKGVDCLVNGGRGSFVGRLERRDGRWNS